jgi:hypothetical protein
MVTFLLIATLSFMAGCKKKTPATPPAEPSEQETTGMMDSMKKAADETVQKTTETVKEAAAAVKESFTMDINLDKTVADLKAEAAKMDVESLTSVAMKYKDAIMEKQAAIKPLMDKLAAIPMTQKMGAEAQTLTADLKKLTDAMAPLKERFAVYIDALKAKGADISKLAL